MLAGSNINTKVLLRLPDYFPRQRRAVKAVLMHSSCLVFPADHTWSVCSVKCPLLPPRTAAAKQGQEAAPHLLQLQSGGTRKNGRQGNLACSVCPVTLSSARCIHEVSFITAWHLTGVAIKQPISISRFSLGAS